MAMNIVLTSPLLQREISRIVKLVIFFNHLLSTKIVKKMYHYIFLFIMNLIDSPHTLYASKLLL